MLIEITSYERFAIYLGKRDSGREKVGQSGAFRVQKLGSHDLYNC